MEKGLIGTVNFEVIEKFTQKRLLLLTRKCRTTLSSEVALLSVDRARLLMEIVPTERKRLLLTNSRSRLPFCISEW